MPFARSRIKALRATGLKYASQQFEIDGCSVKVRIEGEHEFIRLEGSPGYMESGVLDLRSLHRFHVDTYRPATIRLMSAAIATKLPNAGSRRVKEGDLSWSAAGCKKRKDEISVFNGFGGPDVEAQEKGAFCSPERIAEMKSLMYGTPSSSYTGKMRLYVQALYGSDRIDYGNPPPPSAPNGYIYVSTHKFHPPFTNLQGEVILGAEIFERLSWGGPPTSGLMTIPKTETRSRQYLLLQVGPEGVTFRKMVAKFAEVPHKNTPAKEAEAFELAALIPAPLETETAAHGPVLPNIAQGWAQLAYGWHFNEAGDEACIAMRRQKTIHGVHTNSDNNGATPTPASIEGFEFTLWRARFTFMASEDGPDAMGYTLEVLDSGDHIPSLQNKIWSPGDFGMSLLAPNIPPPWDCNANLSAPVYCYYDRNDKLTVVTAKNTRSVPFLERNTGLGLEPGTVDPVSGLGGNPARMFGGITTSSHGPAEFVNHPYGNTLAPASVIVGESSYGVEGKSYFGATIWSRWYMAPGGVVTDYPRDPITGNYSYQNQITQITDFNVDLSYHTTVVKQNPSSGSQAIVIIPHGDASAVIAGYGNYKFPEPETTAIRRGQLHSPYTCVPWGYASWAGSGVAQPSGLQASDAYISTSENPPPDTLHGDSRAASHAEIHLHSDAGVTTLINGEAIPAESIYNTLMSAAGWGDSVYEMPMTVRTSYFGATHAAFIGPLIDPAKPYQVLGEWPDVRYPVAVGFA